MITSRQNQAVKDIRRLRRSKGDHAILEGPHLVAEAAAAGLPLDTVLATPAWLAPYRASMISGSTKAFIFIQIRAGRPASACPPRSEH